MEKLTNVGQNAEKCLHTWETLLEVFLQNDSFICRHIASRWLTCAIFFVQKFQYFTTAVTTRPFSVHLKCQLHVYNGFPMKTGLLTILYLLCARRTLKILKVQIVEIVLPHIANV
jgi:hypothetical protein